MLEPRAALDAIGVLPDVEIDLGMAALQFARIDAPRLDWQIAAAHLSAMARDAMALARDLGTTDVAARAGALAGLINGRYQIEGDTEHYDDLANANLIRVLERRRGLPITIGILWLHCARTLGWPAHGLDFPGHFLIALEGEPQLRNRRPMAQKRVVLDVFAGGIPLDARDLHALLKRVAGRDAELRPGMLAPMSSRSVLLRMQENVRARRLRANDTPGALSCTLDMLRIAPDAARLWREAAAMHQKLDQVAAALRCYARVLELTPEGQSASWARAAIEELRGRLN